VVANHGRSFRTAPGPVAAGPVLGHSERRTVWLGSCQNVVPVGGVTTAADDIAFLGQRGLLGQIVGVVKLVHIPGDDCGLGVLPWSSPDAVACIDRRLTASRLGAEIGAPCPIPRSGGLGQLLAVAVGAFQAAEIGSLSSPNTRD
jgi:hypothetical protein